MSRLVIKDGFSKRRGIFYFYVGTKGENNISLLETFIQQTFSTVISVKSKISYYLKLLFNSDFLQ